MSTSKIEIRNLTVDYIEKKKNFTALKNVSFPINDGEFVSIIGASGCGKSTLLSVLEGINKPAEGEVLIDGEKVNGTGSNRSVVFLSLIHISEPTRRVVISYAVFCLKKFFFNDTATTEIYTRLVVGSVRCV